MVGSFFEQTVADVYDLYEQRMHRANAMDFDDLLVRAVNVLELFPEVRERYQQAFRHVLVDEYQDTNRAQYRWLQLLAEKHRNLAVVGDDDQCLVEGTLVTMADGSLRPIEEVAAGRPRHVLVTAAATSALLASPARTRLGRRTGSRSRPRPGARSSARRSTRISPGSISLRRPRAPDLPDVAQRQGLPRRDHANLPAGVREYP